jgi:hypothetical protein
MYTHTSHFKNLRSQQINIATMLSACFQAGFLIGLFFHHEDEGDMILRNIG